MCSVGDSFNIDLSENIEMVEYRCNDCGKKFKGMGMVTSLKCPSCHSKNTSK
jgi:DNA-directed RNA polymerase subunit RPC12/RpoP